MWKFRLQTSQHISKSMSKKKGKTKPHLRNKPGDSLRIVPPAKPPENTPSFSHKYIDQGICCIKNCTHAQFKSLADKLRILCNLEWNVIDSSSRTTNGYEKMPRHQLKTQIPGAVPATAQIYVFRFGMGDHSGRLAGYRSGNCFHILFVESTFGDLYDHD